ncbi:unnamed protein product [Darwinula stevensoni]|uniref:Ryanodine receptor n=1 Tax=Darwinula stevensoni TaxID=69355 RepID=A0A7R8WZ42_9CRUS|nr:unnamed protein product [Darwinula stevensoni]CAG0880143.1 unnamed protein product [Darwinula stevensoni]
MSYYEAVTTSGDVIYVEEDVQLKHLNGARKGGPYQGTLKLIIQPYGKFIAWQPASTEEKKGTDWTVLDSSAVVNFRNHDGSGVVEFSGEEDSGSKSHPLLVCLDDLKSYRLVDHTFLTLIQKDGTSNHVLTFQKGKADIFIDFLSDHLIITPSTKDDTLFLVMDPQEAALNRSFSELHLFDGKQRDYVRKFFQDFTEDPYATTMTGFSKLYDILCMYSPLRYFEFEILTAGPMKVGWIKADMPSGITVGADDNGWGFDGFNEEKLFGGGAEPYGKQWQVGDVIGVLLDLVDKTISFSLNGELMMDAMGGETAFTDIPTGDHAGYVPAFTLQVGQRAKLILGQDVNALKYFTTCGLQEGYRPFCVNMQRQMTLWYTRDLAQFENYDDISACPLEITRIPVGSDSPPALKISHRFFETMEKAEWEYLRLSLPVTCKDTFIDEMEKARRWQEIRIRQHRLRVELDTRTLSPAPLEQSLLTSGFSIFDLKDLQRGYSEDAVESDEVMGNGPKLEGSHHMIRGPAAGTGTGTGTGTGNHASVPSQSNTLQLPAKDSARVGSKSSLSKAASIDMDSPRSTASKPEKTVKQGRGGLIRTLSEQALNKMGRESRKREKSEKPEKDKKRGKSPFSFLTQRFRNQSGDRKRTGRTPEGRAASEAAPERSQPLGLGLPPDKKKKSQQSVQIMAGDNLTVPEGMPRKMSAVGKLSTNQIGASSIQSGMNENELFDAYCLERLNEYFFGVRIFAGQDPNLVYLGWVSTQYHHFSKTFSPKSVRRVSVLTADGRTVERQSCYVLRAGDLHAEVSAGDSGTGGGGGKGTASQGMFVGCTLDTATGILCFSCDGTPTRHRFRMQPGAKLFPALFIEATSKEMLQIELGRTPTSLPYSAAISQNSEEKHVQPQLPPRLKVQMLRPYSWARVPNQNLRAHALKLSDIRGWSALCEEPIPMLALHIPEEDRCMDILELIEHERFLSFHAHTLALYCAVCYESNFRAAHTLCGHVDKRQLLYAIKSEYLSGKLRRGFYDLLIALHLESFANTRELTQNEFLVPLSPNLQQLYEGGSLTHSLHSVNFESIRPQMVTSEINYNPSTVKTLSTPYIEVEELREFVMEALEDAVVRNQVHTRDPIGGSNENLFVPLLKLCDKLLLIGELREEDIIQILIMIDPETWDPEFDKTGKDEHRKGLLSMNLAEGVKLQLCRLLHHFCDIQLRHRVESIVSFARDFIPQLQSDQLRRYIEIKQSDLPSAVAARKTREFRCPPREQMNAILAFKNLEKEDVENCPCSEEYRDRMKEFHQKRFKKVLTEVLVNWARTEELEDPALVREMFWLLLRQYDGVGELMNALNNSYVIMAHGRDDVSALLSRLSRVRSLLPVQMSVEEEELIRELLWSMVQNRVFFQHPDLMRKLRIHENVMAIMMNTLGRRAQAQSDAGQVEVEGSQKEDTSPEMVVACCRFLCYFCRTGRANQKAMFDHLSFLLENSNILLSRPSLRGSTPLDVAYSSLMDNTELALALREAYLEKIAIYLSRCGLQSNAELVKKGYPDIGWDPVEGERYLDFLRFCVWVSGESVEENANLVIRLLIRRPECLGPALRGEGEGLLKAIVNANQMSERISALRTGKGNPEAEGTTAAFEHPLPEGEEDEDYIDTGNAILNFYCTLVDLLGRCAPDARVLSHGKNEALRARAILRSLVPLEDLVGTLSLRFNLTASGPGGNNGELQQARSDMPPGLTPAHKQSIVLFLERVYGVDEKELFFRLLEEAFLPDLRAATMLDKGDGGESDMALALNRYIGNSVLPLLIFHSKFYGEADSYSSLLDATLHTVYRLSKNELLTKGQREAVSDFLLALTREMQPSMLLKLLRKLTVDVSQLTEYTTVALRDYNPDLFGSSLPCLIAIGCALPPDYTLTSTAEEDLYKQTIATGGPYMPQPIDSLGVTLTAELNDVVQKFSENYHDAWAARKMENGWAYGDTWNDEHKTHPRLKPYSMLSEYERERYRDPVRNSLKALLALGWSIEAEGGQTASLGTLTGPSRLNLTAGESSGTNPHNYQPHPLDMTNLTLSREMQSMAERLAEDAHDIWAKKRKEETEASGGLISPQLVPYDLLTDNEKRKDRERAIELLKYIQYQGFKVRRRGALTPTQTDENADAPADLNAAIERRFAYSLLQKLLQYLDSAAIHMKLLRPSQTYSRRNSFKSAKKDVKFFFKVVLPLIEKYFVTHKNYFISVATATTSIGAASLKEKEMVASLFCRLANSLRSKYGMFGSNAPLTVKCLQVLVRATDAKSLVKNCPEFVRTSMLTFFNNSADDLCQTVSHLEHRRLSHVLGTHLKTSSSLNYVYMVILPVFTALFDHLGANEFGSDLLLDDIQVACYKILKSLFTLGSKYDLSHGRSVYHISLVKVMAHLEESLPTMETIVHEVEEFITSGGQYEKSPHIVDLLLPMLCAYLPFWWNQGPDNVDPTEGGHMTSVTSDHLNKLLKCILDLIKNNIGSENSPWMIRIACNTDAYTQQIIINSSEALLADPYLPLAQKVRARTDAMFHKEESLRGFLKSSTEDTSQVESQMQEEWQLLVRDIYAFYPLLIKYVDLLRSHWLKQSTVEAEELYSHVSEIFNIWSKSQFFHREEQNFISQNEIDNMTLIMPTSSARRTAAVPDQGTGGQGKARASLPSSFPLSLFLPSTIMIMVLVMVVDMMQKKKRMRDKGKEREKEKASSLIVACLKRLLPVGLNLFAGREQELVQHCKDKFLNKEQDGQIQVFAKIQLTLPDKIDPSDAMSWQHYLYSKLGRRGESTEKPASGSFGFVTSSMKPEALDALVERIIAMAKVLFGLHMIDHPQAEGKSSGRKVLSVQRKKAVIACFRQTSLHSLPTHRAINLFLRSYAGLWLEDENVGQEVVIEDLTMTFEEAERRKAEAVKEEGKADPVTQLIRAFSQQATTEAASGVVYLQEQEQEKQKLLFHQSRLAERGAAEMVLLYISACKGIPTDLVLNTLKLGISILRGGNLDIQMAMLNHLKEKKDVGFFTSIAGLMNSCSVLDLDAFERNTKAEGLGVGSEGAAGQKNMHDADFTCVLFRFIQLTCEGHNLDWQNYLRTQAGNTTTVNVVICTVDYLLRLQESIMDFYWHYSSKELIDPAGKLNFFKAIGVASQVFNTLTEVIQGPCTLNQQALAHSRLWDAVGGFMFLFANMQDKLSKHSSQVDLLKELLSLQKDMVIMMLSMLEGNVVNGTIGKQMVDTLVESAANVEMILKFFDMFLKLKDLTSSASFQELDKTGEGLVTPKEFREKMEQQKMYTPDEINYILSCVDTNVDGKIDYVEFTERFHEPAKEIGFNLAVLLTNLSEHMPNDPRLNRFLETAASVLNYFEAFLGRIEIMGGSHKIERVYFEINEDNIEQWEKPQIKESKRAFFYSIVTEGGDKEKLEAFVNFCEDAIFEMQHAASLMEGGEDKEQKPKAAKSPITIAGEEEKGATVAITEKVSSVKEKFIKGISVLSPSNIRLKIMEARQKTWPELIISYFRFIYFLLVFFVSTAYWIGKRLASVVGGLMRGPPTEETERTKSDLDFDPNLILSSSFKKMPPALSLPSPDDPTAAAATASTTLGSPGPAGPVTSHSLDPTTNIPDGLTIGEGEGGTVTGLGMGGGGKEGTGTSEPEHSSSPLNPAETLTSLLGMTMGMPGEDPVAPGWQEAQDQVAALAAEDEKRNKAEQSSSQVDSEPPPVAKLDLAEYSKKVVSFLARNFYNLKYVALVLAFCINFMLLFYKVTTLEGAVGGGEGGDDGEGSGEMMAGGFGQEGSGWHSSGEDVSGETPDEDDEDIPEYIKVPLAIFKREKEIARRLEFDGIWIASEPEDDEVKLHWDKLVISAKSFPVNYWDKFVKKKVRAKYSETYDFDAISSLLGMERTASFAKAEEDSGGIISFIVNIDWRYQVWKAGVTITDNAFLYSLWYFVFSILGNINYFFFAAHLLDVAVGFKTLRTILQSVTHNGKQLVLTMMLLTIVVYIYTVIAFNFFRKFYVQEEDDQVDQKCHDMLTCFVFHLYKGVRAGGGIGDEIEPPDGDDYEVYRIIFDISFFFFVIVILLAIIQGLIIDAFGELRDQLESVKDDMESNCFICGIGKDYFDKVPHGFDTHVAKEHNLANYMFFLMHLINKPDTEYTGQETYVWNMYTQRCWDFFPVGECFRKQYEDEL